MAINPNHLAGKPWLRQIQLAKKDQPVLLCFPHSGASASAYNAWSGALPGGWAVFPVDLPGHGLRLNEPLSDEISVLVAALEQDLAPYLQRRFAFFGHSMGALVGFELARALREHAGLEPAHVFVSGHSAPQLPHDYTAIHTLPEDAFIGKIREMDGTSDAFFSDPELRAVFLPILRADFAACDNYRFTPGSPLGCPITAMGGLNDLYVPRPDLEAWKAHTTGAFKVRMFPGNHFYLQSCRQTLLEILARELCLNSMVVPVLQR